MCYIIVVIEYGPDSKFDTITVFYIYIIITSYHSIKFSINIFINKIFL